MAATVRTGPGFARTSPAAARVLDRTSRRSFGTAVANAPSIHRPFGRPVWRGRMHTWAFVVVIPAGLVLTMSASGGAGRISGGVFGATLALVFGTSAAYHRITRTERTRTIMQKLDHSMIFLLIAGTCAPLCLVAMPRNVGVPLLGVQVGIALIGIGLTTFAFERARRFTYGLYPAMVVIAIAATPALNAQMSNPQLLLMAGGVLAYAVGVPVLMRKRPNPWPTQFGYHEIWHVATILAAALHFVAIRDLLT